MNLIKVRVVACRFWLMTTPNVLKLLVYFPLLQWQYISCDLFPRTQ